MISYPSGSGKTNLLFTPANDDEFTAAVNATNNLADNFIADINIFTPVTLTGTHVLTHQTELRVNGGAGGSLTLGQDAELRYDKCGGNVFHSNNGSKDPHTVCTNSGRMFVNNIRLDGLCGFLSSGIMETNELTLGGVARITGGIFRVNSKLKREGGGVVEVNANCFNAFPAADILDHEGVIHYSGDSYVTTLLYRPTDDSSFAEMVEQINELGDRYSADVGIVSNVELTGQYVLTHKTFIYVRSGDGGALRVAPGAKLEYSGCGGSIRFENNGKASPGGVSYVGGDLYVNAITIQPGCELVVHQSGKMSTGEASVAGKLENGGFVELRQRGGGSDPRMIVTDTGTYSGDGAIGVMDPNDPDSYFSGVNLDPYKKVSDDVGTRYIPADLVLPLGLTSIESEAFADGTFESVYIPGAVTSIAEDAFGDRTDLTIYGEPNRYSRTFAEDKGFNFIRTV
ncbi:MAG: leucine-rich repeat domain-containing protein [Oscillospiraceae bacterium]|nr:leucine-rich repeat domain-containing protein [Oscillospiraceae bacterium]